LRGNFALQSCIDLFHGKNSDKTQENRNHHVICRSKSATPCQVPAVTIREIPPSVRT
jgi:hypothetical protein